jgi:hypothetical protein
VGSRLIGLQPHLEPAGPGLNKDANTPQLGSIVEAPNGFPAIDNREALARRAIGTPAEIEIHALA